MPLLLVLPLLLTAGDPRPADVELLKAANLPTDAKGLLHFFHQMSQAINGANL